MTLKVDGLMYTCATPCCIVLQFRGGALVPGYRGVSLSSLGSVLHSVDSVHSFLLPGFPWSPLWLLSSCAVALLLGLFLAPL